MTDKKKLIEVAIPLSIINEASSKEKSIRDGNISTIHLWWSRKPIAVAKAIVFASLVDDPGNSLKEKEANKERKRLFKLIEELVKWNNPKEKDVLIKVKQEILKSGNGNPPPILDPFCGGGSIPLAGQILGLKAYGSDLNPVAVIITKSLIELPHYAENKPPVNPNYTKNKLHGSWTGFNGLAEDIRYYGKWMKNEAYKQIGNLYPKFTSKDGKIKDYTILSWLYCREVKCPNPACGCNAPLASKFWICTKEGKEAWVEPIINKESKTVTFQVRTGNGNVPEGTVHRGGAKCIVCDAPIPLDYIRKQGQEHLVFDRLIALVLEGERKRIYVSPDEKTIPKMEHSDYLQEIESAKISGYFNPPNYGYNTIGSMFNSRQICALETFTKLVQKAKEKCLEDCRDETYATIISVYLTLGVGRLENRLSSFSIWNTGGEKIEQTFSEQGVAMAWDYAEVNPFSSSTGCWEGSLEWIPKCVETLPGGEGEVSQIDAAGKLDVPNNCIISTDPPYYSSITYADFADFFYGTFRYCLKKDFPDLFSTITSPKKQEIVAAWHRFEGDRAKAGLFFRERLKLAIENIAPHSSDEYPITIYYAFKEKEFSENNKEYFTAWESILGVLIDAGLKIVNTWPLRTERTTGRKAQKNVLASSIVLVCRPRKEDSPLATRRELINALKIELPTALKRLQESGIEPVDLAQSAIGPGMSVFSRYSKVLEADGTTMSIRTALQIINQELDLYLTEQESEMDSKTRFCIAWYEQFGWNEGPFGDANTLATAKGTAVNALEQAGVIYAKAGKVRLLKREELKLDWDPTTDKILTVWECFQHIIKKLEQEGEAGAAEIIKKIGGLAEPIKELAYRLYSLCEKKGWVEDALSYNSLISSWQSVADKAQFAKEISEETKKRLKDKSQKTLGDQWGE